MNTSTQSHQTEICQSIKLGIDAHARFYYVARQVDGATPQPVQKMTFEGLLHFVARQQRLAREVFTCYEAGAFGYHLHRRLTEMGVTNYVVQPQDWDEQGKGVKNDRLDALALCQRLDRFTRGNRKAFSIVRVPTPEQERARALSRQRQQIMRERQRLQAMGRSLLASHGIHVTGKWWRGRTWSLIRSEAPGWVVERLEVFIRLIEPIDAEEAKLTAVVEQVGGEVKIPRGVGALTFEVLRREVGDWGRFTNYPALRARSAVRLRRLLMPLSRLGQCRQVSSYTGLCPREHSSGGKRRGGSINKSGNPRVRAMLVEMVWRMTRWQPTYHALKKWLPVLGDPSRSAAARKKAIVAVARQLAVDLWRLFTAQTTAEKLGLVYLPDAA